MMGIWERIADQCMRHQVAHVVLVGVLRWNEWRWWQASDLFGDAVVAGEGRALDYVMR